MGGREQDRGALVQKQASALVLALGKQGPMSQGFQSRECTNFWE